jgi:hypothetical protein
MQDRHSTERVAVIRSDQHAATDPGDTQGLSCHASGPLGQAVAGVKMVECAQTHWFQRDARDQP